jgi:hypothetical protein
MKRRKLDQNPQAEKMAPAAKLVEGFGEFNCRR